MMMSMDQWDWKTNAPEFVPCGLPRGTAPGASSDTSSATAPGATGSFPAPQVVPASLPPGTDNGSGCFGVVGPTPVAPNGQTGPCDIWHNPGFGVGVPLQPPPPLVMGDDCPPPPAMSAYAVTAGPGFGAFGPIGPGPQLFPLHEASPLMQLQAQYEWQIQSKDQRLRDLQHRLSREELERVQMQADFERDREGLMHHLKQLAAAVERHGIPFDEHGHGEDAAAFTGKHRLDSKLEQLNSLLQDRDDSVSSRSRAMPLKQGRRVGVTGGGGCKDSAGSTRDGASGSGRRVTFPSDLASPAGPQPGIVAAAAAAEAAAARAHVESVMRALEQRTGSTVDTLARQTLDSLGPEGAREALRRVEELVQGQNGRCTNLSSILQSVCRKIRRRGPLGSEGAPAPAPPPPPPPPPPPRPVSPTPATQGQGRRCGTEGGISARLSSAFPDEEGPHVPDPRSRHPFQGSDGQTVGDPHSSGLQGRRGVTERSVATSRQPNLWSTARFERLSKQGAFDLRKSEEGGWELRICMREMDPPLTDEGMQIFCRWLHQGLRRIKEESGVSSMRHLRAEVDFAKNGLSDAAIGRLLQALQRDELQVTSFNFFANNIGAAGAQHISDFIRGASFPLHELRLSYNKLDDEAVLDLIRAIAEHPKYPPRRPREGGGEARAPVWLRLNNNQIRDPAHVLKTVEAECGVTVCLARNHHACGPSKCGWRPAGVPLVHMFTFHSQDSIETGFVSSAPAPEAPARAAPSAGSLIRRPSSLSARSSLQRASAAKDTEASTLGSSMEGGSVSSVAGREAPAASAAPRKRVVWAPEEPSETDSPTAQPQRNAGAENVVPCAAPTTPAEPVPPSGNAGQPSASGAPERTPEPEAQPAPRKAFEEPQEQDATEDSASRPVKLMAPPRILQRGAPSAPTGPPPPPPSPPPPPPSSQPQQSEAPEVHPAD